MPQPSMAGNEESNIGRAIGVCELMYMEEGSCHFPLIVAHCLVMLQEQQFENMICLAS